MLKLYNTLTRKKQVFKPIRKNFVGMYVCGPTVYDYVHIGNLRAYILGDIMRRYFKFKNYKVKHVMNITDVDDKTIKKSMEEKISLKKLTLKYEKFFLDDIKAMNIEMPEVMPKATEHIKEMVVLVKNLLEKRIAYKAEDGIYFSIKKFKDYGKLSRIKLKELKIGAGKRVAHDEYDKEDAHDFALWKFWDKSDGDVFWETELGKGRPGWHIECSAMSCKYLGETFDIHAGGVDLVFPHHENEIAQSEAANEKTFVKYWLHNEWVLVDGRKMSKSLKNFYKLKDITDKGFSPLDLRYFYLTKTYRQKFNFSWKNLKASKKTLERLKNIISELKDDKKINREYLKEFENAMDDDLNTPRALQVLWKLVRDEKSVGKIQTIKKIDEVFGLDLLKKEKIKIPEEIKKLVREREDARKKRDFKKADELRDEIKKKGFSVEDVGGGSKVGRLL